MNDKELIMEVLRVLENAINELLKIASTIKIPKPKSDAYKVTIKGKKLEQ
jgi:hypothetical protein